MKPISLTIAGLHSFREKQTIDFQTLCEGGVFGIFGPTGSGKSTILDAMTLALFGSVERAPNNTHGIMNHAENELFVSFTFELENASCTKRYTVERSFKRGDEWRLKSGICRLIEVGAENVVLADKSTEVNKAVEQLLGLTMKDFTRAVVLPQGKFAEFLSLKGAERRQMLQRLFHLEPYGDKLNKKLKEKLAAISSELNEVIAEKTGLGDASKEAVERAKQELDMFRELLQKWKAELHDMERKIERNKQLWAWQTEKKELEAELARLSAEEPHIRALENKKERAEQAERMWPYLERYEEARRFVANAQQKQHELRQKLAQAAALHEKAMRHYEHIRQEKAASEPRLLAKKEQLIQAKQLAAQIRSLEAELNEMEKQIREAEGEERKKRELWQEAAALYERGIEKQQMLKTELQKHLASIEQKEVIEQAYDEKQQIERIADALQHIQQQLAQKQQAQQQASEEAEKRKRQAETANEKLRLLFQKIEKIYHSVCERQWQLEKLIYRYEQHLEQEREKAEQAKTAEMAAVLAKQLRQGEPCPVCGSCEHPNPYVYEHHDSGSDEKIAMFEQQVKHGQSYMQMLHALKAQLEQMAQFIGNEWTFQRLDVSKWKVEEDIDIAVEVKALQQDCLQLKEAVQQALQKWRDAESAQQAIEQEMRLLEKDIRELQTEWQIRLREYNQLQASWREKYADFSFTEIEVIRDQMRRREETVRQLQKRIDDSIPFLDKKLSEKEQLAQQLQEIETEKVRLVSLHKAKQQQIDSYKQQLLEKAGTVQMEKQLLHIEQQLLHLKSGEEQAYQRWLQAQKQYQTLDAEAKAIQQSLEEGKAQYEEARSRWLRELEKTAFADENEVKEAKAAEEKRSEWEQQINDYWQKVQHAQHRLEQLAEAMGGETIDQQQWEQLQAVYEEVKQQVDGTMQQVGATQNKVEELTEKHKRFVELEKKQQELTALADRYKHLQSILKGNSFVEFLAEEQLIQVTRMASERLSSLTRQRYSLEIDSQGGFLIRDDANGGVKRPVTTLSGGETFLTSLSLALALSAQIQLRGEYPLRFFFLDEGFGTLDAELLDTVISALEKLHSQRLSVGVISHVQEIRARLPKRLIVEPAEPAGRGTRVRLEVM
ncbi:nuclease SbcCD subunit C [Parageobacillus thermoglucosidasius]|uniref:AAA family ATPase n=1 Tax=Parageobacillus thermoglucosidasius TaxID=1426 RepID=UPI000F624202|nr:SbcC/MukB-like Walker B domain-containing protein [Parageobacillus thermoglucosidasius]GCD83849.1 nuclease SbcCD subunit C [Parageobacillus thermoglucosidasius]